MTFLASSSGFQQRPEAAIAGSFRSNCHGSSGSGVWDAETSHSVQGLGSGTSMLVGGRDEMIGWSKEHDLSRASTRYVPLGGVEGGGGRGGGAAEVL
jgi:hypothetical protein